jgi:hypothetical protein
MFPIKSRHVLREATLRCVEVVQDELAPEVSLIDVFTMMVLMHSVLEAVRRGHPPSIADLSRSTSIPRTTVSRWLTTMMARGAIERRGKRYVPVQSYLDVRGDRIGARRLAILKRALSLCEET